MPDLVKIFLAIWVLLSTVSVFICYFDSAFEDRSVVDTYRKYIRYTINHKEKFTPIGRLIIIPIYTLIGCLLPVPAIAAIGPVYLLFWVIYQSFRLIFFKTGK